MISGLLQSKVVVLLLGLIIAGMAWYGMSSSAPEPLLNSISGLSGPDQDLVQTLLALRSVKLDGTIFSESAFTTLEDYSTPIIPEPVHRDNPFAPLSGAATSSLRGAQIFSPGGQR